MGRARNDLRTETGAPRRHSGQRSPARPGASEKMPACLCQGALPGSISPAREALDFLFVSRSLLGFLVPQPFLFLIVSLLTARAWSLDFVRCESARKISASASHDHRSASVSLGVPGMRRRRTASATEPRRPAPRVQCAAITRPAPVLPGFAVDWPAHEHFPARARACGAVWPSSHPRCPAPSPRTRPPCRSCRYRCVRAWRR